MGRTYRKTLILSWIWFLVFSQDDITEDDIDDSFKSMFAQLAGEVRFSMYVTVVSRN